MEHLGPHPWATVTRTAVDLRETERTGEKRRIPRERAARVHLQRCEGAGGDGAAIVGVAAALTRGGMLRYVGSSKGLV